MVEWDGKSLKLTLQWGDASVPFISFSKTFRFCIDDTVWVAKQAVLLEFASLSLSDPLNYGFYMPPFKGKSGKFLSEERLLRDYPAEGYGDHLEFRYKRRIYRSVHADEKKLQKYQNKTYQRKFLDLLLTANLEKAKQLLEKGLDPNFQDEKTGETPLTAIAVIPNCSEACMLLVNYGAHIDYRSADGLTALHKATVHDRTDCITNLLDLGASPNYKNAKGLTPLYHGIVVGAKADTCELLLNERAVIGISDHQGSQELHQACQHGRETHLDHLIFYGADLNCQTAGGNTPLHICAISNQENCARVLLFRGADKNIANYSNQTAYDVAVISGNDDIAALIADFSSENVTVFLQKPIHNRRKRRESNTSTTSSGGVSISRRDSSVSLASTGSSISLSNQKSELPRTLTLPSVLPSKVDVNANKENMFLKTRKTSKGVLNGGNEAERKNMADVEDSGSEISDSDEETNKSNRIDRRTFTSAGVGSKRAPAPIKTIQGATLKNRLYPSIPGRQYVALVDYQPKAPGELLMDEGDIVELLYIGEQGFWEGRVKDRTGWFPSACVEELKKSNKKAKNRTWFGKKSHQKETLRKVAAQDSPTPKTIIVKRGDRGYGFQLRGANSHMARIEFTPSPQFPALQYIGEIDKGEAADKVGLRPGDFILEVNGEDVRNATHGHVVSLVANSGKTLTLKVVTVAGENSSSSLSLEVPNMQPVAQPRVENTVQDKQRGAKMPPPPLPRGQYSSLTMGPLHRSTSTSSTEGLGSPVSVDTVITLDKKVKRNRSVKSMWTDTALKLNQPDNITSEEISKGVIRRNKVMSVNLPSDFNYSDTDSGLAPRSCSISSRSSNASDGLVIEASRMSQNATMPRRVTRSSSQSSIESDNSNRPQQPPNYEDTLENMRRIGRKPSIKRGESESRIQSRAEIQEIKQQQQHSQITEAEVAIPSIPSYAPPSPPDTPKAVQPPARSISVPGASTPASSHPDLTRRASEPGHLSSDDDEPTSEFAKNLLKVVAARNSRLKNKKLSIDEAISQRRKEQNLHVIKENEEANRPFDAGRMTKSSSSDALLQSNKLGDSFSLYTASSTSSLDTQYSKDSGIDVSEVIAQAPGEQPPDLASALANAVAKRAEKIACKDVNASTQSSNQGQNPTLSSGEKNENESNKFPAVKLKKVSNATEHSQNLNQIIQRRFSSANELEKTPPPTRPKPKVQHRKSSGGLPLESNDVSSTGSDCTTAKGFIIGSAAESGTHSAVVSNPAPGSNSAIEGKSILGFSSATGSSSAIGVAGAANDSTIVSVVTTGNTPVKPDTVSIASASNVGTPAVTETSPVREILTPPIMFAASKSFTIEKEAVLDVHDDKEALPPPPTEFLAVSDSVTEEIKEEIKIETQQPKANIDPTDPPPPYSPPRAKTDLPDTLTEKAYIKWTAEDVGAWLDYINMGQYKTSFIENDIQGMHLSELSKDDLSELGVKKLGHRLTIDDSIGKLRNNQFSEV